MNDQLPMFDPTTCGPIVSATSSPASADGPTLSDSLDGMTLDLFGREAVPASPSAPPVRARRAMTNATCGLRGFLSSASAALQQSLESRLKRQLDGAGSTLFSLAWRRKATPAGRPYYQLAASARRTSDSDFGSWQTPTGLQDFALTAWATPTQRDYKHETGLRPREGQGQPLNREALGTISPGSPAQTEKRGQLNPDFSLWLMGYPPEWASCAPPATRSSRKSRRNL
jgi:hypothetical protein